MSHRSVSLVRPAVQRGTLIALALLGIASLGLTQSSRVDKIRQAFLNPSDPTMLVIAHRGHTLRSPENSLAAIRDTADTGAHMAEIDIRKTSDGVYILMHDASINRTTDSKGDVAKLTFEQLRKARLRHGVRPTNDPVPTLQEAFEAARGQVMLNLDPKDISVPEVVALARKANALDHCLLKGNWSKLDAESQAFILANPDVLYMPICSSLAEVQEVLKVRPWPIIEVTFASPGDDLLKPEIVKGLRKNGTRLWVNTLQAGRIAGGLSDNLAIDNPDSVYGHLARIGYGAIQTDLPEKVTGYFKSPN